MHTASLVCCKANAYLYPKVFVYTDVRQADTSQYKPKVMDMSQQVEQLVDEIEGMAVGREHCRTECHTVLQRLVWLTFLATIKRNINVTYVA